MLLLVEAYQTAEHELSDVDIKRVFAQTNPMPPRLMELEKNSNGWGNTISGMFSGELPDVVSPASLQGPTTPIRIFRQGKGTRTPFDLAIFQGLW